MSTPPAGLGATPGEPGPCLKSQQCQRRRIPTHRDPAVDWSGGQPAQAWEGFIHRPARRDPPAALPPLPPPPPPSRPNLPRSSPTVGAALLMERAPCGFKKIPTRSKELVTLLAAACVTRRATPPPAAAPRAGQHPGTWRRPAGGATAAGHGHTTVPPLSSLPPPGPVALPCRAASGAPVRRLSGCGEWRDPPGSAAEAAAPLRPLKE